MTVIAGRYRLLDVLAEGTAGTVWRALDETSGHDVALKEFHAPAGLPADELPLLYARREREARAASRITHPSVVRVLGVATEDGRPWVVTELVRGLTLAETLEAGPLPPREAARVGAEVLAALRAGRKAGAPHRGAGPEHVLLANDGRVVMTGFGAAPEDDPGPEAELRSLGALLGAAASSLPSADDRTEALRAVIEGLSRQEPSGTPADVNPERALTAERELRRIATGGARPVRRETSVTPPGAGPGRREEPRDDLGKRNGLPGGGSSAARQRGTQPPRRGHVLLAGAIGALLIAGALTYQAVRDDERGPGPGPSGVTSTAPTGPGATGAGVGAVTPRS
ncbi:protein kinase domain-containing protein [Streptomyces exfoliatus]|uniref:protein kinase domain-containing protein n=1 Tax=Streptomyces exfoliatus TaxID=1905 RepID=UPI003C2E7F9D